MDLGDVRQVRHAANIEGGWLHRCMEPTFRHGAIHLEDGSVRFRVWAPRAAQVEVRIAGGEETAARMEERACGYWEAIVEHALPGARYVYRIDGALERPDPASRFQPEGVHGPSEIVDAAFDWQDGAWWGQPIERCVLYELHVGTFTREGSFDAIVPHLEYLRDLGVTFLELMPVAQFPGRRNWGYDGVYPFAVQNSYGGPQGLKRLVNACHRAGLGVVLDVVYNHLGPEGNYLAAFGPYFTSSYKTPWGDAINFDGPGSDEVRRYFIENALYWIREFHIDGLRLDAVHGIFDRSAYPFVEELGDAVREEATRLNRRVHLMAESDLNDPRLIRSKELGGMGLDAQWADGFHHALRVLLTGERSGYYQDFGEIDQLAKGFREGYVYSGEYSKYRGRRHGASAGDIPADRFVVFSQNHDQIGNRMLGDRPEARLCLEDLKLAAAAVIFSPHIPLLFMGEEYGETAPFLYFVSHTDAGLVEAVRRGRKEEFAWLAAEGEPPEAQAEETFLRSKLELALRHKDEHATLLGFYRTLLRLRREVAPLAFLSKEQMSVVTYEEAKVLLIRRWHAGEEVAVALCFSRSEERVEIAVRGLWRKLLDSTEAAWGGSGSALREELDSSGGVALTLKPRSAVLYRRYLEGSDGFSRPSSGRLGTPAARQRRRDEAGGLARRAAEMT
jgi:maltooligosyltrehalose trehalohydrolase